MKILYAEDNPDARYLLETLLRTHGYEIITVADGAQALKRLCTESFDLIISDILMPHLDGFMLCHQVKSDPKLAHIPFILYSATYTQTEDILFAKRIGADEFIVKPLPPQEFLQTLERIIQQLPKIKSSAPSITEEAFLNEYAIRVGTKLDTTYAKLEKARGQMSSMRHDLEHARRMLGSLADHSSDGVVVVNSAGSLLLVNPGMHALMQMPQQLNTLSLIDLFPRERCTKLLNMLRSPSLNTHAMDFQETLHNGQKVLITSNLVEYMRIPSLMLILRSVDNVGQNATPADLHSHVMAHLVEGVMITDIDNNIISVNAAFTRVTGYPPEEVLGKNPRMLKSGRQDLAFYKRLWSALNTEGHWQGEVWNRRKSGEVYPEWLFLSTVRDEVGAVAFHVGIFSDISEHEQARQHIEHLAHHDALTDLPNRHLLNFRLNDAIHHAARNQRKAALLFLDLDHFKLINDTLGHVAGDELLKIVGERLQSCVRQVDTVGRQGGDEFLVVIADLGSAEDAAAVAQKILNAIGQPCLIAGKELNITPSLGIALYPDHGIDEITLVQHADDALYHAKDEGRNNFQFYNTSMHQESAQHLSMSSALSRALEQGELSVVYQPQVRMSDNTIVGCEALLRWHNPELGDVPPASFIPVAEETGRINAIGEWVLNTACRQAATWQTLTKQPFTMAVNLSAIQFRQPDLLSTIQSILSASGLDAQWLELELTESILMREVNATAELLQKFKAMQIKLSMARAKSKCNILS